MTLSTRDRSVLFDSLSKLVDPEAVDAMLAHFPARDVEEPITRDYLDARLVEFREEIRLTLVSEFRAFDAKIGSLRVDLEAKLLRSLQWTIGTMIALAAVIIAVVALG